MSKAYLNTLRRLADLPTAPFVEGYVADTIKRFVAGRPQLRLKADRFGNLIVKYTPRTRPKTRPKSRPILFAAHMDHPGFVAGKMIGPRRLEAEWRGWVLARYFQNERVKFFTGSRWIPGTVEKVIRHQPGKTPKRAAASARTFGADAPPKGIIARVEGDVSPGSPGVWSMKDAVLRGHRFHARACDDLAGVAAILCMLNTICRRKIKTPCYALFTRAEEVGFGGALAAVDGKTIPRGVLVVAVECSKAIPGVAALGDGPVLRVGDKASIFTPSVTAYCQVVAEQLAEQDKTFRFQRKLMDGGTCESTAFCHYGYDANCICLPLTNYHNMDTDRRKIAPESIDGRDYVNLVKWFVALAESPARLKFDGRHPGLGKRLDALLKQHRRRLARTAN